MESSISLAKAISEYGGYAVILSIFLIVFIYMIKANDKQSKKLQDQLLESEESYKKSMMDVTTKMIEQLIQQQNDDNKKDSSNDDKPKAQPELFTTFTKLRTSMYDICKESMNKLGTDRLAIYLFHNGTHSTHGIKFFKISCICESIAIGSGIREHSIEHANIPINLFDSMIDELISNGKYVIVKSDDLYNSSHRIFLSANKIKYSLAVSIFDRNNNILGFILSESSKSYDVDVIEDEEEILRNLSNQLVPILAYSEYIDVNINKALEDNNIK